MFVATENGGPNNRPTRFYTIQNIGALLWQCPDTKNESGNLDFKPIIYRSVDRF